MFISSPSFSSKTMMKIQGFLASFTLAAFGNFCLKSYFDKSHFQVPTSKKILKNVATKQSTFKIDKTKVPLLFRISYSLVPKIEICIKYFSDKNLQKQPLWYADVTTSPYHQKLEQSTYASQTLFPYTCLVFYELSTFYIILLLR